MIKEVRVRGHLLTVTVLVAWVVSVSAWSQVIHYRQNFDNLKDGPADGQDGWAVGAPALMPSTIITSKVKHGAAGKAMELNAMQEVIHDFSPPIKSGVHFLSLWFRVENPTADNTMHVYMGEQTKEWNAGPVIRIGAQSTDPNKVGVHDGQTVKPVADIKKGEWQRLLSVMNVDKQTYTVSVDEVVAAKDFAWRNAAGHKALGWLMLGFDAGAGLIGYYDDVVYGEGGTFAGLAVEPVGKVATTWADLRRP